MALTQRDQIMIAVCVAAAGLGYAYWQYLWKPKDAELVVLRTRVESMTEQNESARRDIARGTAAKVRDEADQYGRLLNIMRRLVPVANEVPTLLEQISTAARSSGLELGEVTPLGVIPGEVFDTHRYKMGVTGPYHRVAQFLTNVGSLTRIVAPMNLTIAPSTRQNQRPRPGEQPLDASFEIQTYVAKTAPQAGPATPQGQ